MCSWACGFSAKGCTNGADKRGDIPGDTRGDSAECVGRAVKASQAIAAAVQEAAGAQRGRQGQEVLAVSLVVVAPTVTCIRSATASVWRMSRSLVAV